MNSNVNVTSFKIKNKLGVWFFAGKILEKYGLPNNGENRYRLVMWLEKTNTDKIKEHCIQKDSFLVIPQNKENLIKICLFELRMNQQNCHVVDTKYCINYSFTKLYETDRQPGMNSDGTVASDMLYCDMDDNQLLELSLSFSDEIKLFSYGNSEIEFFNRFKLMSACFFSKPPLENILHEMIENFRYGGGRKFSNEILSLEVSRHETTKKLIEKVKSAFQIMLRQYFGDVAQVAINVMEDRDNKLNEELHWKSDNSMDWTPNFSTVIDMKHGLQIMVNDVWGYKIDVLDYCMFPPDSFTCILKFTLYDHFGLNKEDLFSPGWKNFLKQSLAGFRSWFFLQHYNRFDGRFKPFITEMTFTVPLAGVLHDNN